MICKDIKLQPAWNSVTEWSNSHGLFNRHNLSIHELLKKFAVHVKHGPFLHPYPARFPGDDENP